MDRNLNGMGMISGVDYNALPVKLISEVGTDDKSIILTQ